MSVCISSSSIFCRIWAAGTQNTILLEKFTKQVQRTRWLACLPQLAWQIHGHIFRSRKPKGSICLVGSCRYGAAPSQWDRVQPRLRPLQFSFPPLAFPSPGEEGYFQTSICFVFNVQKGCTFSGTLFISSRLYNSLLHKWRFLWLAFVELPTGRENITCLAVPIRKNEKALHTSQIAAHRKAGNQTQSPCSTAGKEVLLINSIFISIIFLQVTYVTGGVLNCCTGHVLMAE